MSRIVFAAGPNTQVRSTPWNLFHCLAQHTAPRQRACRRNLNTVNFGEGGGERRGGAGRGGLIYARRISCNSPVIPIPEIAREFDLTLICSPFVQRAPVSHRPISTALCLSAADSPLRYKFGVLILPQRHRSYGKGSSLACGSHSFVRKYYAAPHTDGEEIFAHLSFRESNAHRKRKMLRRDVFCRRKILSSFVLRRILE